MRDPLNSISMAAQLMEMQSGSSRMSARIKNSSSRMQRLVSQVLDMARLQTGLGLNLGFIETDISALLHDLVEENLTAYPDVRIETEIEAQVRAQIGPDRVADDRQPDQQCAASWRIGWPSKGENVAFRKYVRYQRA
ncbi:histidine kinase dimerization/phospho-acceptor domain-containing protein [Methylobacillus sp. Pita1]|uniref:histidine kinase dimerization/phospho-acceptor domain-containing protein n=1 Tax=Methylobacillus sp. Pita1 TaxID=3382642 RepID=UPI0038B4BF55